MAWSYDASDLDTTTASGRLKLCSTCKEVKSTLDFHKDSSKKDGFRSTCKSCKSVVDRVYRQNNQDKVKGCQSKYYENNKELFFNHNSKRRAKSRNATPSWLSSEQKAHMKRTHKLRLLIEEATGVKYHVDHIVPLNGKSICGLNVPWNLEVIQAKENLSKSNKFEG